MDAATASLIGVGIGGVVSLTTAALTARMTARAAQRQLALKAEQQKLESLMEVVDAAGLALEEVHWAVDAALDAARLHNPPSTSSEVGGSSRWSVARKRMDAARDEVSRQGTRLAIRLGDPTTSVKSPCVAEYNALQRAYRTLVEAVPAADQAALEKLEGDLKRLEDHHSFLNQAAELLRPKSAEEGERRLDVGEANPGA